jgi:hypothetical protein
MGNVYESLVENTERLLGKCGLIHQWYINMDLKETD